MKAYGISGLIALMVGMSANCAAAAPKPHAKSARESERCVSLSNGVTLSVKSAALASATGLSSASDQADISNKLTLMKQSGCRAYAGHISPLAYIVPATNCSTAMVEARNRLMVKNGTDYAHSYSSDTPAECQMSKWEAAPID